MSYFKNLQNDQQPIKSHVDLQLYHYGEQVCHAGHSWGPGIKDHYKIHIIFEGEGTYRLANETYRITQGQAFLTTPDQVIHYQSDDHSPWTYAWFAFDGLNAKHFLQRANLSLENPVISLSEDAIKRSRTLLTHMLGVNLENKGSDLTLMSILYALLALLINEVPQQKSLVLPTQKDRYLDQALDFIAMNYSRKMTLEEMATRIGIHRKYMAHIFKEKIHTTPQNYLMTFRIEKAKHLLKETPLSISEIGYSVGYDDALVFSKAFKKIVGVSPTHFQKNQNLIQAKA